MAPHSDELDLTYGQVGVLLSLPGFVAIFIEPWLGILADLGKRRLIILAGGVIFSLALILSAFSQHYEMLLIGFVVFYPASGAFVGLAQTALMDDDPNRHEQNMARWTFAGSAGVVAGTIGVGALVWLGPGWRGFFLLCAVIGFLLVLFAARQRFPTITSDESPENFMDGIRGVFRALKRADVRRWLILLEVADLMMDVLYSYLALYMVDVAGATQAEAGIAVLVWTGVGLVGDFLLIPLLEHVRGLTYLRYSAVIEGVLFATFLLIPGLLPKMVVLGLLGLFNAGWYSILSAQLYSAMPGQSGTTMAVGNVSGLLGRLIPLVVGLTAEQFSLGAAMWLMMLGPIGLLIGIPRQSHQSAEDDV